MEKIALSIPGYPSIDTGNPPGVQLTPLPKGVPTGGLFPTGVDLISVFIEVILISAIFLSLFFIARGGFNIITSRGDKEKLNVGRQRVIYSLLGLIMVFLSFFMISIISTFFGFDLLPFVFKK